MRDRVIETRTEDAKGNVLRKETYTYDADGNKTKVDIHSESNISSTHFIYNSQNLPVEIKDAEENITRINYRFDYVNSHGITVPYIETIDTKGNFTIQIGNAMGKTAIVQKKNALGVLTQQRELFYDGNQRLIETRETVIASNEPDRQVINQWRYNATNRLTDCIEAVGTIEQRCTSNAYNAFGEKITLHKPDGSKIHFTYDEKGRVKSILSSDQTISYTYEYDENDQPIYVKDLIHNTETLSYYDACDRLEKEILGNGLQMEYTYDRLGRVLTNHLPDQSCIEYIYNAIDLIAVKRKDSAGKEIYSQTYSYDTNGNVLEKHLPYNLGTIKYEYDNLLRHKNTKSPFFKEEDVKHDLVGNVTSRAYTDPLGKIPCSYQYDDLYQIKIEESSSKHIYEHDSLYNRIEKDGFKITINALNQLIQDKQGLYQYDLNGNLSENDGKKYGYDAWNRLSSVTDEKSKVTYQYDEHNRRLSKTHLNWSPLTNEWEIQDIQYFLYQFQNEIGRCEEKNHFSELRVLGHGRGAEIGASIAHEINGKIFIPLADYQGNTCVLIDTEGKPVEIHRYTTFGEETVLDNTGELTNSITPWRFSSKRVDPETGLINFGNRYYNSKTGRWITADPLGHSEGLNLYAYLANNPLTSLDLYGLSLFREEQRREQRLKLRRSGQKQHQPKENNAPEPEPKTTDIAFENRYPHLQKSFCTDLRTRGAKVEDLPNGMGIGISNGICTFYDDLNYRINFFREA